MKPEVVSTKASSSKKPVTEDATKLADTNGGAQQRRHAEKGDALKAGRKEKEVVPEPVREAGKPGKETGPPPSSSSSSSSSKKASVNPAPEKEIDGNDDIDWEFVEKDDTRPEDKKKRKGKAKATNCREELNDNGKEDRVIVVEDDEEKKKKEGKEEEEDKRRRGFWSVVVGWGNWEHLG